MTDALLAAAERAVEVALARGADEAEAYVQAGQDTSAEIEDGHIACASTTSDMGIGVRVIVGGRLGFASQAGALDAPRVVDAAMRMAGSAPVKRFSLPAGGRVKELPGAWDSRIAELEPGQAMAMARRMVSRWQEEPAQTSFAGGGVTLAADARAISSSQGVQAHGRSTSVSASASMVDSQGGISAWAADASHHGDVDAAEVVDEAVETVRSLRGAQDAPWHGPCDIVLTPHAATELVTGFIVGAAAGDEAMRGNTVWAERLGQQVAAPALTVRDDPLRAGAVGATAFDDEGIATTSLPILEAGVLRTFLFDAWDAAQQGMRSTASAVRDGYASRPTTGSHHVTVDVRGALPLERLLGRIDKGYLVESVLGAHTTNPTTGAFSVTAPNLWRIEGGRVTGACREVALAGTVPQLLEGLAGASDRLRRMDGRLVPHLWFQDVSVSV